MDMNRWERRGGWRGGRSVASGIIFGAAIIAVGTALLLDNLNIVHFEDMWEYWPVALIIYGVVRMAEKRTMAAYIWGGMAVFVGVLFLLQNLHILVYNFDIGAMIWPLILIGFGVSMLLRTIARKRDGDAPPGSPNPNLGIWAIFSGFKRRIEAQDFKGGEVVAVFGGVHLDLRHAAIAGDRAVIDINALFGGIDIRVPENWSVTMKGVGIFGAFEDKTVHPRLDPGAKTQELVITGTGVFAGIKADN
jgi:hypothetical protein